MRKHKSLYIILTVFIALAIFSLTETGWRPYVLEIEKEGKFLEKEDSSLIRLRVRQADISFDHVQLSMSLKSVLTFFSLASQSPVKGSYLAVLFTQFNHSPPTV